MRINAETLRMRIFRLQQKLAELCMPEDAPADMIHVLNMAPKLLREAETALHSTNPMVLEQVHELLKKLETYTNGPLA